MSLLSTLERYYDAAPRPLATTEPVGPFTLFVSSRPGAWPFYARPAPGQDAPLTAAQVEELRRRQRELGVPESLEWVHETTPSLSAAAREAGLQIAECPLMVLPEGAEPSAPPLPEGCSVAMLGADSGGLPRVLAAISAGFADIDEVEERPAGVLPELINAGLVAMAGAHCPEGVVGGGTHSPRDAATELTGIAVLPRARRRGIGAALTATLVADARSRGVTTVFLSAQDEAVARVYERVGFQRVGTACVASPPPR